MDGFEMEDGTEVFVVIGESPHGDPNLKLILGIFKGQAAAEGHLKRIREGKFYDGFGYRVAAYRLLDGVENI